MSETLSNLGTAKVDAEETTNRTDIMSEILAFSPHDGLRMVVENFVDGKAGIPIYLSLQDTDGNDLPLDTEVTVRFDAPHLDSPQVVAYTLSNIRQYRSLDIKEQQSEDYRDRTRVELKGSRLVVEDTEEMQIAIDSSEEIDWDNSEAYVDESAVSVNSN